MIKVAFITQEDSFVIPQNIERVLSLTGVETQLIAVVDSSGAVSNRKLTFAKGFGLAQSFRMGIVLLWAKFLDVLDAAIGYQLPFRKRSVRAVARKNGISFRRIKNANDDDFVNHIESLQLDLIVSYSCPSVFRTRLLRATRMGCINLHCSFLPHYAGLLPSFWVLYHGEKEAGATVHYMDDKIDNGEILAQCRIPIEAGVSMFELIHKTKKAGGKLMALTVEKLMTGTVDTLPNLTRKDSYFSWPTIEEMKEFRRCGGRLI